MNFFNFFLRLIPASKQSIRGLRFALDDMAFVQQIVLFVIAISLLIFLPISIELKLFILFSHTLLLIVELLNTAVEKTIDRISLDFNELSKKVKDMASAAVFIALLLALTFWVIAMYQLLVR
ncbi:MAG: diacylglycerol kinase [Methylacidiphilales bacterium]|nr:diacylglycerol kinase [Candidatus Methylacidiphilales bacterium]